MMADNAYHAGIVRDVAAMNAASDTGYTMTDAATDTTADAQLNVHDFLSGLAQLRDILDNTNDDNNSQSTDTVWLPSHAFLPEPKQVKIRLQIVL